MQNDFQSFELADTGMRFYSPVGKKAPAYPSVTTIINAVMPATDHLKHFWRQYGYIGQTVFKKAGEEGERVHTAINALERGDELPSANFSEKEKKCIAGFLAWRTKGDITLLDSERIVISKKYKYAGRFDAVYHMENEDWLIDFKSGQRSETDKYQIAAYYQCFKEERRVTHLKAAILYLNSTSKQGYTWTETDPEEDFKTFLLMRKMFDKLFPDPLYGLRQYPEIFKI